MLSRARLRKYIHNLRTMNRTTMDLNTDECLKGTLEQFVAEWKRELGTSGSAETLLGKRGGKTEERESAGGSEEGLVEVPVEKRVNVVPVREPSPLLVLPAGRAERGQRVPVRREADGGPEPPSLLDTLLADLDDINTVPFFEVKLPREVAILVFSHLSMADLCRCARVSRSWHSLAEDNVLWSRICHRMGYKTSLEVGVELVWKRVVKEIVLRKKKELKNWKERICGLSELQPDTEGVLLCVDFCHHHTQLLAGYSSGAVYLWTLTSEEGPVTLETDHTHLSPPTLCRIQQGWAAVATQHGMVTVYDTCVGSRVHCVRGLGLVACLDLLWTPTSITVAVVTTVTQPQPGGASPVVYSDITVLTCQEGREWQTTVVRPHHDHSPTIITQLSVVGSCLLYSTQCTLSLLPLPSPPSLSHPPPPTPILTSAGSAGSTVINCFDHTPHTVACATSAWGYHVQLYDLTTSGHMTTLRGHAQPVTSVNIHNSPVNTLVSGSADRRVRVFDTRSGQLVVTLCGHHGTVISTQCDDWKVTSGGKDGLVVVWDRRMSGELWSSHERHPVVGCWFDSRFLVAAHVPEKGVWSHRSGDHSEPRHRCQRGLLRVMDFSVDPLYYTRLLPSICSSAYDEPFRSLHHLDLKLPYDTIT